LDELGWLHWLKLKATMANDLRSDIRAIDEGRFGAMNDPEETARMRDALQQALERVEAAMKLVAQRHLNAQGT